MAMGDVMQAHSEDVIEEYRGTLTAQGYSASAIYQRVRLLKALGVSPSEATRDHVLAVMDRATKASSRRVYLNMLRATFSDLRDLGLVNHDPTVGLKTPTPPRGRPHPLNSREVDALLGMTGREREWTLFGLRAGLRAHEVVQVRPCHLEWSDQGWSLRIPNGKGSLDATVPAHPQIVEMLEPIRESDAVLWPIRASHMSSAWRVAAESVGVTGRRFHDLRHTFASTVYRHTGDLLVTRDLLRHASVQTTQVYAMSDELRAFDAVAGL
jgi:integrase